MGVNERAANAVAWRSQNYEATRKTASGWSRSWDLPMAQTLVKATKTEGSAAPAPMPYLPLKLET